jgi:hypothetical protein
LSIPFFASSPICPHFNFAIFSRTTPTIIQPTVAGSPTVAPITGQPNNCIIIKYITVLFYSVTTTPVPTIGITRTAIGTASKAICELPKENMEFQINVLCSLPRQVRLWLAVLLISKVLLLLLSLLLFIPVLLDNQPAWIARQSLCPTLIH